MLLFNLDAVFSHFSKSRDATITCAPFATNPSANILPMPEPPPVINTFFPLTENKSGMFIVNYCCCCEFLLLLLLLL